MRTGLFIVTGTIACAALAAPLQAKKFGPWSAPVNAEVFSGSMGAPNSPQGDGCPILDPYTNDLYIASTRPGGLGGLDIWIAEWNGNGWDEPVNPGAPVNSPQNDYCPTPARGNRLFFVSRRDDPNGDIYVIKRLPKGYGAPQRLPDTVNSAAEEWSPSWFEKEDGTQVLYFSSTRLNGQQDIYASENLGPAQPVSSLNTTFDDARPNVRRDGLEVVFDSTRPGGASSAPDIWSASRPSVDAAWSPPVNLTQLNSPSGESRASLSWDGKMIVFGSGRDGGEGATDIYVATRD